MNLDDVLNNWVQLKLVADYRPDDEAAQVSLDHVTDILSKEYKVQEISVSKHRDSYDVMFTIDGHENQKAFTAQSAEVLLQFINENPERYDFK
jgi:hypothetical protein